MAACRQFEGLCFGKHAIQFRLVVLVVVLNDYLVCVGGKAVQAVIHREQFTVLAWKPPPRTYSRLKVGEGVLEGGRVKTPILSHTFEGVSFEQRSHLLVFLIRLVHWRVNFGHLTANVIYLRGQVVRDEGEVRRLSGSDYKAGANSCCANSIRVISLCVYIDVHISSFDTETPLFGITYTNSKSGGPHRIARIEKSALHVLRGRDSNDPVSPVAVTPLQTACRAVTPKLPLLFVS